MNNETTASRPKSIGDDAQFRFFQDSDIVNCLRSLATDPVCGADVPVGKALLAEAAKRLDMCAPAAQASAFLSLSDDDGFRLALCKYNVGELTERDFIEFLDDHSKQAAQASATIQAAPEDERTLRAGRNMMDYAKRAGWPDDGEGAFEFLQRTFYEAGAATVKAVPSEALELAGMVVKATFGDHKILVPRVDLSGKGIGTLVYFAAPLAGKTGGGE